MTSLSTPNEPRGYFFASRLTKRQKLTKWSMWFLIVAACTSLLGLAWRQLSYASTSAEQAVRPPLQVATITAQQVDHYERSRNYTGMIREARRSEVSFQRGGEVLKLLVDEGDRVEEGQLLAELDDRHIRANQAQLISQLDAARAELDELLAGPRPETIAAKRAELASLEARSAVLKKQLFRREELVKNGSVTREEYETFLYDFRAAEARSNVTRRQLDEMLAGTRKEQIDAQRARTAQLEAKLADVNHDLEDARLTAPFRGRVSKRFFDEGTVVAYGTPVFELLDDTRLEAWIGLPTSTSASLVKGERRQLTIDDQHVAAEVHSLAPNVDRTTRTQNVILQLVDSSPNALPGQVVRLRVVEKINQPGYWVPTTSLTQGERGLWSVFVVKDAQQREIIARRDVELLDTVGTQSFVRGTLQSGDRIVSSGAHRVVVGQHVTSDREELTVVNLPVISKEN